MKIKFTILIALCSVIGGLAQMNLNCRNDGSTTLSNCQSNPNIRVEKIRKFGNIRSYKLSLYYQNTWWPTANNDEWIECKDLCDVCESLPGIDDIDEVCSGNQCEQRVDMFINSFCASATPTTHTSTVTDTQTISVTETTTSTTHLSVYITSISHFTETVTSTSRLTMTETVTSVMPITSFITRTTTETESRTITSTTTEMITITPSASTTTVVTTAIVTVTPSCIPRSCLERAEIELTQPTQERASIVSKTSKKSNITQQAPTITLGILAGVFVIALTAVISGWVWTCWTIKKRKDTSNNMVETSETKGCSFDLKLSSNPAYETMVQPHSSVRNPMKLTVDINTAYEATKSKPRQKLQDESEPKYEVISTAAVSSRDS